MAIAESSTCVGAESGISKAKLPLASVVLEIELPPGIDHWTLAFATRALLAFTTCPFKTLASAGWLCAHAVRARPSTRMDMDKDMDMDKVYQVRRALGIHGVDVTTASPPTDVRRVFRGYKCEWSIILPLFGQRACTDRAAIYGRRSPLRPSKFAFSVRMSPYE